LLNPYTTWLRRVIAFMCKYRHERDLPKRGVFSVEPLRKFMDKEMPRWPDKFWTFAVSRTRKVLFTADGVITYDGARQDAVLSTTPAPVGTAVCATCAVPGIIDAVPFGGEYLWDGAMGDDGACPVDMAKRHFGAAPASIIAFDVGEEEIKKSRLLRFIWNLTCGGKCNNIDAKHPSASDGVVLIEPRIVGFHALKFRLGRDLKWGAVIAGVVATVESLAKAGMLKGPALAKAESFSKQLKLIESSSKKYGELTARTEAFLSEQGLY
jgi:predicted acylesterase/phospholipase RssA